MENVLPNETMNWKMFSFMRLSHSWDYEMKKVLVNGTFSLMRLWNGNVLINETFSLMRPWNGKCFHGKLGDYMWKILLSE